MGGLPFLFRAVIQEGEAFLSVAGDGAQPMMEAKEWATAILGAQTICQRERQQMTGYRGVSARKVRREGGEKEGKQNIHFFVVLWCRFKTCL